MHAAPVEGRAPSHLGVRLVEGGASVAVYSRHADAIHFCLFDEAGERETQRWRLAGRDGDLFHGFAPGVKAGVRYGLRADGPWEPARGHRFDPEKLLIDPYATRLDRVTTWSPELSLTRDRARDTAPFMPRAIIEAAMRLHRGFPVRAARRGSSTNCRCARSRCCATTFRTNCAARSAA